MISPRVRPPASRGRLTKKASAAATELAFVVVTQPVDGCGRTLTLLESHAVRLLTTHFGKGVCGMVYVNAYTRIRFGRLEHVSAHWRSLP